MNTYNITDPIFMKSEVYQNFVSENPSEGYLRIRAYAASQAIPISGLKVIVSKIIDNYKVIFFEGTTNSSGIIDKITLPAPKLNPDNQEVPVATTYDIETIYEPDNLKRNYKVNMYENIYVIQNISIVPNLYNGIGGL